MARAVEVFKLNAIDRTRREAESTGERERLEIEKRRTMMGLADQFEAKVGRLVGALAAAATELEQTAHVMSHSAAQANEESAAVASGAQDTANNVQSVATALEELSTSAQEIGVKIAEASQVAARADRETHATDTTVAGLAAGAERIVDVVGLIRSIAEQTNLLALNATIEAARAGEAGKGFAVVASEVKTLAMQAARATDEIAAQVGAIQSATTEAVRAIQGIGSTVREISSISSTVAAAAEQQQSATQEIARGVGEAARKTEEVSGTIERVKEATMQASAASEQVRTAASELSRGSNDLARDVQTFLAEVRAA
jgi:methyl-accepting chemotaxis protein